MVKQNRNFRRMIQKNRSNRRKEESIVDGKHEKLVIHENAFYEIDLDCLKRKQEGKRCLQDSAEKEQKREQKKKNPA